MYIIEATNVDDAIQKGVTLLLEDGVSSDSRNGVVWALPAPVMTVHHNPLACLSLNPVRRANPFFHFFEALWMLVGGNDVKYPATFVKRMHEFSDDGRTLWGAYGHRWRHWFHCDQLGAAVHELKSSPHSRRVVISMWDGVVDPPQATAGGKDVPCNTHIYLRRHQGTLDMTVCCRSNDMMWGAYGANAVHFPILLSYLAHRIGVRPGKLYQLSNNMHVYTEHFSLDKLATMAEVGVERLHPLDISWPDEEVFNRDMGLFHADVCHADVFSGRPPFVSAFFKDVVWPLYRNWLTRYWDFPVQNNALTLAGTAWLGWRCAK